MLPIVFIARRSWHRPEDGQARQASRNADGRPRRPDITADPTRHPRAAVASVARSTRHVRTPLATNIASQA
jgi:hypothetical protein